MFDKQKYFETIETKIRDILSRNTNETLTYDILDTENKKNDKLIALRVKQHQMKIGEIWQTVLGNYDGYIDLGVGHETGLDILSHSKKIIIELKNRTNTDNSSSRKANLDKLAKFKIEHPDYTSIYANINADDEKKTMLGKIQIIQHNGVEIQHQIGYEFLKNILEDNVDEIIYFVRDIIDKYS